MDPSQIPPQITALSTFSLHVTVYIQPERINDFFEAMRPVFDKVTSEPECLYFEIYQDPMNEGTISWVENWDKDAVWFMSEQATKEYMQPYFKATEEMYVKPREFKILRRIEGYVAAKEANFKGAKAGELRN